LHPGRRQKDFGENFGTNFGQNFGRNFGENANGNPSTLAHDSRDDPDDGCCQIRPDVRPPTGRDPSATEPKHVPSLNTNSSVAEPPSQRLYKFMPMYKVFAL
jgi:hypothetical protein